MRPVLSHAEARARLVAASALTERFPRGAHGARALLDRLGCIQLDPIDRCGTNAELVAWARVDGLGRGALHAALAGHTFEHFAKERCLLHPRFFPAYRERAPATGWWRTDERWDRVSAADLEEVLAELHERGPAVASALTDRGRVDPIDWSGWKGTASRTAMALELLWTDCRVVVSGRDARGRRVYDLPERALGAWAHAPVGADVVGELVVARVRVAGVLSRAGGPHWSMLSAARTDGTVERLVEEGRLREVGVEGSSRRYLVLPEEPDPPGPLPPRLLGPLDPLIWDRELVREVFGFTYLWEVYKPAAQRRWGYYVCPIVAGDGFVGRAEVVRRGEVLEVVGVWDAPPARVLRAALARVARANGCAEVRFGPGGAASA